MAHLNGDQAAALMVGEDMTNAVWNRLLHDAFPSPDYFIAPEYHFELGGKDRWADLVVVREDGKVVLAYEGKKEAGGIVSMGDAMRQATDALKAKRAGAGVAISSQGPKFLIGSKDGVNARGFVVDAKGDWLITRNFDKLIEYLKAVADKGGFVA